MIALRSARRAAAGLAVLVTALACAGVATPADAATPSVRLAAVTSSSLTVSISARAATGYRLYASSTKSNLYVANLHRAHAGHVHRTARIGLGRLPYAAGTYWYRVEVLFKHGHWYSAVTPFGLRPPTPTRLTISRSGAGLWLSWTSAAAGGFVITQGTNAALTQGRRNYTIQGPGHQFTPYGLSQGRTYYFRVRALNEHTLSGYSNEVAAAPVTRQQGIRVMTYNVLEATFDGQRAGVGAEVIAPWSQRQVAAAALIRSAAPDVVGVQEAAAWSGAVGGPRMIDTLVAQLGGTYALARTEVPPTEHGYFRTGNYVLYRRAAYAAVGTGGNWAFPYSGRAAYQVLRDRTTGARVLAVSVHLTPKAGGTGDAQRKAQTALLISDAAAAARAAGGVPIVYAGDFNTDVNALHAFDGPGIAMRAVRAADALDSAQTRHNAQFNSSNRYLRTPPASGDSIDHIYASAGVAVLSWSEVLHLARGRFAGVIPSDHNPVVSDLAIPY